MGSYENEQQRLQQMLEEVMMDNSDQEVAYDDHSDPDESDQDESDNEEQQLENSDSEQEISDHGQEEDDSNSTTLSFIGKDNVTRWRKCVSQPKRARTRQENIVRRLPGSTLATKNLAGPLQIWEHFFNDEIINIIVECTNEYIESVANNFARRRDATPTNRIEIRALIGLLYMAGVYHGNRLNGEDLWATDGSGVEIFRLTMSLQRFRFLLRCLRFDSKETRAIRRATDKLAPIRAIFDKFVANCQSGYFHSEFVTVDEMLAGFRRKCSFRQYIPFKPNKYGLKILALCYAKMFYTSKIEIYVGTQPEGPYRLSNSPYDVVLRLCEHIFGTGRNITMDNWFTSIPLVKKLFNDHKLTVLGTVRKNKRELPLDFSQPAARPEHSSMFAFSKECTLVSYIPKKRRMCFYFLVCTLMMKLTQKQEMRKNQ